MTLPRWFSIWRLTLSSTLERASLRDPQFAVLCAEREANLSHRKDPFILLSLAQAYHAADQTANAEAVNKEGLSMLPLRSLEPQNPPPQTARNRSKCR